MAYPTGSTFAELLVGPELEWWRQLAEWAGVLTVAVVMEAVLPVGGGFVERTEMIAATVCYLCPSGDYDNWDRGVVCVFACCIHERKYIQSQTSLFYNV
jgi:hypothetical protein